MKLAHPLDKPTWSALSTRQAEFARGNERALRFAPEYGPHAGLLDNSPESVAALGLLDPGEDGLWLLETEPSPPPAGMRVDTLGFGHQMIAERLTSADYILEHVPLGEDDAAQMLALAKLTEPGPFAARTYQLGGFVGVKQDGRLVAMAGERIKPEGFTEVSGVCTHPDYRGRGYAGGLMRVVAARILARGEIPFLHVYADNVGAIKLYESLGFVIRRAVTLTILVRAGA